MLKTLERLADTHAARCDAQLHARVGNQLLAAGEVGGAADVVGVALERFPDHAADLGPIVEALRDRAEHGSDEERARLATIPYLSGR
ncbi:MAG: hypothetical protein ACYTG2_00270 [Planctomycetota bacterium]